MTDEARETLNEENVELIDEEQEPVPEDASANEGEPAFEQLDAQTEESQTPDEEQELWSDFIKELVDERAFGLIASPVTIDEIEEAGKGALSLRRQYRGPGGKGQRQCD